MTTRVRYRRYPSFFPGQDTDEVDMERAVEAEIAALEANGHRVLAVQVETLGQFPENYACLLTYEVGGIEEPR